MRVSTLATLVPSAIPAVLARTAPANNAAAMPFTAPSQLGLADGGATEKTVLVCGPWGAVYGGQAFGAAPLRIGVGGGVIGAAQGAYGAARVGAQDGGGAAQDGGGAVQVGMAALVGRPNY